MAEKLERGFEERAEQEEKDAGGYEKDSVNCDGIDTKCVMSHICYKYSSMVMSGLIEALDYFAGNQGTKVLVRILAKSIPMQMMEALEINPDMIKNMSENEMIKLLPEMIAKKGGPKIEIEKNTSGEYRFTLDECHFLPYSKSKGFCNVTAGLMLGLAQLLSKQTMNIKEVQTIAHGGEICEFIASLKKI